MPPELGAFMLGYLLIMASPGPNMVAIGTLAALEGLASALPMIVGIACGAGGLASFVLAVSELMQVETLSPTPQFLAGLMLLTVAWAVSRTRNFAQTEGAANPRRSSQGQALFLAGFSTAALFWFACAVLMARPTMRVFVRKREGLIRTVAAMLIAVIALPMLLGALGLVPGNVVPNLGIASMATVKP
ncbi:MAG: hypothetical protein ACK53N_10915 [Alphaproteobacteria bacterium]|jgi:threonine/homoserine/homoserine lactone efflux protein